MVAPPPLGLASNESDVHSEAVPRAAWLENTVAKDEGSGFVATSEA